MIVPDGKTIFVGGLIKHRVDESKRGVPIIGRVPGIGRLFSNRQKTLSNTETVVLITPTIVVATTPHADDRVLEKIRHLEAAQLLEYDELNEEMNLFFGAGNPSEFGPQ